MVNKINKDITSSKTCSFFYMIPHLYPGSPKTRLCPFGGRESFTWMIIIDHNKRPILCLVLDFQSGQEVVFAFAPWQNRCKMSPFSQLQLLKIHTKTSTNFTCRTTCATVELKKRLSRFLNFTPARSQNRVFLTTHQRCDGMINVSVDFILASNTSICRIYNWNSIYESNLNKIQLSMSIISPKSGAFWLWAPINFPATVRGKVVIR